MLCDDIPLVPKNPHGALRTLAIGRVSKPKSTDDQTEQNLESSIAAAKAYLDRIYSGPIELKHLAEQASGLIADRATALEAMDLIETGEWDVVIAEDLGRIFRNPRYQYAFVQDCLDADTRVICFADGLDTADENWEVMMGAASFRHGLTIPDARRRVKRTATFAFHSGGNVQKIKYGYRKLSPDEARSGEFGPVGLRMARLPECTPHIRMLRQILMAKMSYVPVLKWLRENEIPAGPYVRSGRWSQRVVKALLTDPILIGVRRFRTMVFKRVHRTGRFRREPNPRGPEMEHYPKLAHLTDDEFVTLQQVIEEIADRHKKKTGPDHPLYRRRRSDSIFPRQHATCAVCGGLMYAYDRDQMKCENAHTSGDLQCWNHVQVKNPVARELIVCWILSEGERHPGFRSALVEYAWQETQRLQNEKRKAGSSVNDRITNLEIQAKRLAKAIAAGVNLDAVVEESREIDRMIAKLRRQQEREHDRVDVAISCASQDDIDGRLETILLHLAKTSNEFAELMRLILPRFEIVPIQAIDTGQVYPRARITLSLDRLLERNASQNNGRAGTEIHAEIDLFKPPKHLACLHAARELKRANPKLGCVRIARALSTPQESVHRLAVRRALKVAAQMEAEELDTPYRVLTEKPGYASRWRDRL